MPSCKQVCANPVILASKFLMEVLKERKAANGISRNFVEAPRRAWGACWTSVRVMSNGQEKGEEVGDGACAVAEIR